MQSWFSRQARSIGMLLLALGLVGSTYIAASSWVRVKLRKTHTIEVTGSAKRRIVSDLIKWDAVIETRDADRVAAYRTLSSHADKATAYLKSQGVKDDEIRVSSVSTGELFEAQVVGSGESRVERQVNKGFETRQTISVTSPDVARVERVSREVTRLIESGVPITSKPPAYLYTRLGELKIEMLAEASKDARARATRILESAATAKVGNLVSADMGVINVNPADSTGTSWDGNNDTTTLEKDIITIVHCTFEIEP